MGRPKIVSNKSRAGTSDLAHSQFVNMSSRRMVVSIVCN